MDGRGRTCPLSYRHGAAGLVDAPSLTADVAWIAGGLYGNIDALAAIEDRVAADAQTGQTRLVFNGDFHWFDTDREDFAAVQARVVAHTALAGNVEAELGAPDAEAGCGCAYPEFIDDATVERSNRIIERLRHTAAEVPGATEALSALPRLLRLKIAGARIGVVHGDPDALAGWGLSVERVAGPAPVTNGATVRGWAETARVDAFACTHTCLPWAAKPGGIPVINNGSAGMPNFRGRIDEVLVSRIAPVERPAPDALYCITAGGLRYEAIPITIDGAAWRRRFTDNWPPGSPAHVSYYPRMTRGPAHSHADARPAPSADVVHR
ncbi:MAG: metallophosphoesterase family protein [Halofilum sp. (in: g-proteobacteria)]